VEAVEGEVGDDGNEFGLFGDDTGKRVLMIDNSIYCLTFFCMIDRIRLDYGLTKSIDDYFFKSTMVFLIQSLLSVFILYSAWTGDDNLDYEQPTAQQMTLRLICCYLFHLVNYRDASDAFKRLKFLRNYPEKFNEQFIVAAFLVTFFHLTSAIMIEFVNIIFMTRQKNLI